MNRICVADTMVSVPMPIFLIVEDVGWWRGEDGSLRNEPYRNSFDRRHCLADYRALARLAERLSMRIALGMVLGEWDRTDFLRSVPGATWMGEGWNNAENRGPWLDEAARFLRDHRHLLEIAMHGLCHEFWQDGRMVRSEFHDRDGRMRPREIVRSHLEAFAVLLEQNGLPGSPRLFCPPALHHSFGNGDESIQALLHEYGIDTLATRFCRARQYTAPIHPGITWECGVTLLERGSSPVNWDVAAAAPIWDAPNPILALHWSNLLHPDPDRNGEVVDGWADLIVARARTFDAVLAEDLAACRRQAAAFYLAGLRSEGAAAVVDLSAIPTMLAGPFTVKIGPPHVGGATCTGGRVLFREVAAEGALLMKLLPDERRKQVAITLS